MSLALVHDFPQEGLAIGLQGHERHRWGQALRNPRVDLPRNAYPHIVDQLEDAASGKGPNVRWTRTLSISGLIAEDPGDDELDSGLSVPSHLQHYVLLTCQKTTLIPAILAMKNVGAVQM
jgi:hypothetical protein